MTENNLYCLILAGGKGRRLWPYSRVKLPKQFIDFFGCGKTQLQMTYERFRKFIPADHILVSTNIEYRDLVKEQLPELNDANILAEPIWRNTAPSIAWGTHRVYHYNNNACIIIAPSDQQIIGDEAFERNICCGYEYVKMHDCIMTLGVKPTRAECGYGYIQLKENITESIYSVRSFTEKPGKDFAQMFMESGEFYWNTGIFMAKASHLLDRFRELFPVVLRNLDAGNVNFTIDDENRYVSEHFCSYPNISMEQGILDKTTGVDVMKCDFGWADLGTWHSMYEASLKDESANVVLDSDVILENSNNNIIKVEKGHLAVINGLNGYIVVEKDDVLLICPKEDSSALIRKYSAEVEIR